MAFQSCRGGAGSGNVQQAAIDPSFQALPNGIHIANDLAGWLFLREIESTFSARAGCVGESGGKAGFACSRSACNQHTAAAEETLLSQHSVKARNAGRNALSGSRVIQTKRGDGHHRNALAIKQERIFVGSVRRTAILHHAETPDRKSTRLN